MKHSQCPQLDDYLGLSKPKELRQFHRCIVETMNKIERLYRNILNDYPTKFYYRKDQSVPFLLSFERLREMNYYPVHDYQEKDCNCLKVNNQLEIKEQLTISKILNFHSKHLCFEHF